MYLQKTVFLWLGITLCLSLQAQSLPDLTFHNVTIWPERNGAIQVLEDSEGYLWMTSAMGVHRYDGKNLHSYFQQSDSLSISANYTEMLFEDKAYNIWIGTTRGGIDRYDRTLDCFHRIISPKQGLGHVCRMIQDNEGTFWIAAANGLFSMDPQQYTLVRYIPDTPPNDVTGYGFRGLEVDARDAGRLWVAGLDGAYQFDKMTRRFTSLEVPMRANGKQNMLMDIHHHVPGELWCGTWFGGLMFYQIAEHQWLSYMPPDLGDGRWYEVLKATYPLDQHRIWVAGGAGFGIFDVDDGQFHFYPFGKESQNGLDSSFSYAGICMTKQGNVVVTGLTSFSISSSMNARNHQLVFPPVIGAIEMGDKPYLTDTASARLSYVYLNERQKDIAFNFSTPGNYSSYPVEYQYKLEGYDQQWQTLHDNHMVRYTNLPGGKYRFEFAARIGDQDWLRGQPISIEKAISLLESPWLYVVGAGVLLGLLYLIYRIRLQQLKADRLKAEYNQKLADTEMALLRSQMNPHFIFNSLNSIKFYILNEEPDNANKYLTKFSKLMRLVLKNSQSKLVNLGEELEALQLYIELESLRFKEEFHYRIEVDQNIDRDNTYIPPLIIQPYVENAIWHGLLQKNAAGSLDVTIGRKNGLIKIEIADDGIGREAAEELRSKSATKKSFGTKITRDRIALVKEIAGVDASVKTFDLCDETGNSSGTCVVIEIPLITGENIDQVNLN